MITRIRTYRTKIGAAFEAVAALKEMVAVSSKVLGRPAPPVVMTLGGTVNEVSLIMTHDSLAESEELLAKVVADPGVLQAWAKLAPHIETNEEKIYKHV